MEKKEDDVSVGVQAKQPGDRAWRGRGVSETQSNAEEASRPKERGSSEDTKPDKPPPTTSPIPLTQNME